MGFVAVTLIVPAFRHAAASQGVHQVMLASPTQAVIALVEFVFPNVLRHASLILIRLVEPQPRPSKLHTFLRESSERLPYKAISSTVLRPRTSIRLLLLCFAK